MSEPAAANASFRAALERIIDQERVALATAIAWIRIAAGAFAALSFLRLVLLQNEAAFIPSAVAAVLYLGVGLVVFWLLKTGRLVARAGWLLPVLDAPLLVVAQLLQTARLPVLWQGLVSSCVMMIGLVVLSSLSLSRGVIVLTALVASIPILYRSIAVGADARMQSIVMVVYASGAELALAAWPKCSKPPTRAFLAMEFIDGVSLKDLTHFLRAENRQMPIELVVHLAWQLTEALDYIHSRVSNTGRILNLVHRDLNPPNIMLTHIGDAKLADFGIALIAGQERMTQEGIMRGKLAYSAPEQVLAAVFDARADLFALGLTLHECLTGNRVFRANGEIEMMQHVLNGPIATPMSLRADVPPQLDEIVMGLVERDLERRTPSAHELRRQLVELPRHLLDVQNGRRLLSGLVLKTKDWLALNPPGLEPSTRHGSGTARNDATATHSISITNSNVDQPLKAASARDLRD